MEWNIEKILNQTTLINFLRIRYFFAKCPDLDGTPPDQITTGSIYRARGKPSTRFPREGLVELKKRMSVIALLKFENSK